MVERRKKTQNTTTKLSHTLVRIRHSTGSGATFHTEQHTKTKPTEPTNQTNTQNVKQQQQQQRILWESTRQIRNDFDH